MGSHKVVVKNLFSKRFFYHWLQIARRRALFLGLTGEDADDYVSAFITRCVSAKPDASSALIYRSALNAGTDYLRARHRATSREAEWPDESGVQPASANPSPEACALQDEVNCRIVRALSLLTSEQREVFRLCVVEEKSAMEAAAQTNRTPHAVRQALCSLLKRLRAILEKEGFTEADAREYLQILRQSDTLSVLKSAPKL